MSVVQSVFGGVRCQRGGVESAAQLPFGANTPLRYRKVGEAIAEP